MSALPQVTVLPGDCRERMRAMATASAHCCVTSPPYWGLRDYGLPPLVWGGKPECAHEWHTNKYYIKKPRGRAPPDSWRSSWGEAPYSANSTPCMWR